MSRRFHIVGVVGNDIINDSRVKKVAASAAASGFQSTILCYTASGTRRTSRMGDVDVVRVPVPFLAHNKNGRVPAPLHPFNGAELGSRHAGPRTHLLARRRWLEAKIVADSSKARRLLIRLALYWTRASLKLRHETFRVRRRAHVEVERAVRVINRWRVKTTLRLLRPFRDPIPNIADYEVSLGPVLEELAPDVIHAHDFHMIGIAVTAATNLRRRGHEVKVVYDAHEWIPGLSYPENILRGWLKLERGYINRADGVAGISPEQIEQLRETYGLQAAPTLVLNAPPTADIDKAGPDIRSDLAVDGHILTYHGNIPLERGLGTLIEALQFLDDDVFVAILAPPNKPMIERIKTRAAEMDLTTRVHVLDYVAAHQLPHYLSTADVSVIPYLRTGNNDIALPNKLFESVQAGLPVVVSNMRSLSRVVSESGIGEVFKEDSPEDLAAKVREVLAKPETYRARITSDLRDQFNWDTQARRIVALYSQLLGIEAPPVRPLMVADTREELEAEAEAARPTRLAVGPRNMAGQAFHIANAVQSNLGIPAISFSVEKAAYQFPIHIQITEMQWRDPAWQENQLHLLSNAFTHVLAESGTGMLGSRGGGFIDEQLDELESSGISVGVLLHGSEIRNPDRHRGLPHSPYAVRDESIRAIEQAAARLRDHLDRIDVPVFVTTPDLLKDIPATWLPVALDTKPWAALKDPFQDPVPTVLHLPSNSLLKGSAHVDPVLRALDSEGLIRYLRPDSGTAADNVPSLVETADIVVDQIVIGAYGLMSCQSMAAGRLSIANIRDIGFLRRDCPIIDADPDSLDRVMRDLLADRSSWESRARAGKKFVETYHNGEASARALQPFLGID